MFSAPWNIWTSTYLPLLASQIGGAPGRSRYTNGSGIPSNILENIRIQGYFSSQIYWRMYCSGKIWNVNLWDKVHTRSLSNVLHSGRVVISSPSFKPSKPTIHGMRGIVCLVELALRAFLTKDKSADKISHHCFWLPPPPPPLWLLLSREIA